MQRGKTNQNRKGLFMPITFMLVALLGTTLFLYFYFFQVPSLFSLKRFLFSFACAGLFTSLIFGIILYNQKFRQAFAEINFPRLFLQAFLLTCYFIFFISKPTNHLLTKSLILNADFHNQTNMEEPLELLWINNGLRDISYSDIQFDHGEISENSLKIFYNDQGHAYFTWEGVAWDSITIVSRSNEPFTVTYTLNKEYYEYSYHPETNQDYRMVIPIHNSFRNGIASLMVHVSSMITISMVLLVIKLLLSVSAIKNSKLRIKNNIIHLIIALPLFGILLYLIRIGFHNRLYSDDYCYLLKVRNAGYFASVNRAFHKLNGRFMSHIADYLLFVWEDKLMPFGMLFSILLLGGSLMFLFNQIIGEKKKKSEKYLLSFILSAMVTLTTFFIVPFIYESAFWALHALIVFGGFAIFNIAMAIVIRSSKNPLTEKQFLFTGIGLLILGFISCGFHENTGILIILVGGFLWLLMKIFLRHNSSFTKTSRLLFIYLIGCSIGFLLIIFLPGEQGRLSGMHVSYAFNRTLISTYYLTLVKLEVLFNAFQYWGFFIIIFTGLFAFLMGKYVSDSSVFYQINIKNKFIALLFYLFPFLLIVISFMPSTFINNYYPNRTLIIPLYFFVLTFFMISFFTGTQFEKGEFSGLDRIFMLIVSFALITAYIIHFVPIGSQFAQFSHEWDQRDEQIRRYAEAGLTEIKLVPYEHSFGIDISTTNNLFLLDCFDEYYDIHVIPPK